MKENSHIQLTVLPSRSNEFRPGSRRLARGHDTAQAELQQLKAKLLRPVLEQTSEPELCHQLYLAANEAMAEAWGKPFPFLLLSCLWDEKVRQIGCWFKKQQQILNRTQRSFERSESAETPNRRESSQETVAGHWRAALSNHPPSGTL